jgi:uncharacterized membrane protein
MHDNNNDYYLDVSSKEDRKIGCCAGFFLLIYVVASLFVFIGTIIMFANGGWNGFADNCNQQMRDTMLAFIIAQFFTGGMVSKTSYAHILVGVCMILIYAVITGIITNNLITASEQCHNYIMTPKDMNSPYGVVVGQTSLGWFQMIVGIVMVCYGCSRPQVV